MIAVFDEAKFKSRYPEFAAKSGDFLSACFEEACLYLDNSDGSLVQDVATRLLLLNMLVAHISALASRDALTVGRVQSGSQGSVSASMAMATPGTEDWFTQTQYGASFWRATAQYRSAIYILPY